MKAVLNYRCSPGFRDAVKREAPGWLDVRIVDEDDEAAFAEEMRDADVLLHVLKPVTARDIERAPKLRLIQKIGVGVNTIDLEMARTRNVCVANMPGTNSQAVAEITLALMLATLRRVPLLDRETRAGRGWYISGDVYDGVGEVSGKTVGLVGFGEVPQRLAPVLEAMGARVIFADHKESSDPRKRALPDLLRQADILSLHVPLTAETQSLVNRESISTMKRGVVLVNTARGGLVDEAALCDALTNGQIAGAGLDVLCDEPANSANPLLSFGNVVVTPHIAWLTPETLSRSLSVAFDNCARLRTGQGLRHVVVPADPLHTTFGDAPC